MQGDIEAKVFPGQEVRIGKNCAAFLNIWTEAVRLSYFEGRRQIIAVIPLSQDSILHIYPVT